MSAEARTAGIDRVQETLMRFHCNQFNFENGSVDTGNAALSADALYASRHRRFTRASLPPLPTSSGSPRNASRLRWTRAKVCAFATCSRASGCVTPI